MAFSHFEAAEPPFREAPRCPITPARQHLINERSGQRRHRVKVSALCRYTRGSHITRSSYMTGFNDCLLRFLCFRADAYPL